MGWRTGWAGGWIDLYTEPGSSDRQALAAAAHKTRHVASPPETTVYGVAAERDPG